MRFLKAVLGGYVWASFVTFVGCVLYLWLHARRQQPIPLIFSSKNPWELLLLLHFDTFFWVWAVTGMVLSCLNGVVSRGTIYVRRTDVLAPPQFGQRVRRKWQ